MDEKQQANSAGVLLPGQIWLIEQLPGRAIGDCDRDVMAGANVILYDRNLAPLVAAMLPLGTYAEALAETGAGAGPAISRRALHFAADGWSVVQLVAAGAPRQRAPQPVTAPNPHHHKQLRVRVLAAAATDAPATSRDACACQLPALIEEIADRAPLSVVVGPLAQRYPIAGGTFTANGLAG